MLACNRFYPYNILYMGNNGFPQVWGHSCTCLYQNITDKSLLNMNQHSLIWYLAHVAFKSFDLNLMAHTENFSKGVGD